MKRNVLPELITQKTMEENVNDGKGAACVKRITGSKFKQKYRSDWSNMILVWVCIGKWIQCKRQDEDGR